VKSVSAREANQAFSRCLAEAEAGEEILITRRGRPVAKLVPITPADAEAERQKAIDDAIRLMRKGFPLGGLRVDRNEIYDERMPRAYRDRADVGSDEA
jgi:prevent-host-death family protein